MWLRYVDDILIILEGTNEGFGKLTKQVNGKEPIIKYQEEIGGIGIKYLALDITIDYSVFRFDI